MVIPVTMVTQLTVPRKEVKNVKDSRGWILIYGRRKVGKTFLVRNFIKHDVYILVKRGGGALITGEPLKRTDDYSQVIEMVINELGNGKVVVVDEFQRLPEDFIDSLQMCYPKGKLILLGSSMHVAKDITSRKSPLLGLLSEIRLSVLSPSDTFVSLSKKIRAEDALMLSPYLRDPWSLRYIDGTPEKAILNVMEYSKNAIPALIGETFLAEDRFLSEVYEGVLRSIANGKNTLKEVSDQLFSKKLIKANNPSLVRPYVRIMEDMDLIERVPLYEKRGNYYSVKSKIMELYYYLDEKYDIEAGKSIIIKEVFNERAPLHIQFFIGELMAELLDGTFRYHMTKDYDIDIIVTKRRKPVFIGEVKWRKKVKKSDISKFIINTEKFECRKALISRVPVETEEVEVITPKELLKMASDLSTS
jgi:AAA+ ATPase superfamily predicted ATPase